VVNTIRSPGHEALCAALVAARRDVDLTQAELAQRLRCHQSFVARIESGERRIDVIELVVLARALGTTAASLLAQAEAHTPPDHRI
jgi:transcriptional regulator with XRE-family HTH domain